jgi:phosphoribosylformylglycinamidine synthase subunit PurS
MKAKIHITPKRTIMDAQGQTVQNGLHKLGYTDVNGLRIGKYLEMELAGGDQAAAQARVEEMCAKLLANPIIEDYKVEIE